MSVNKDTTFWGRSVWSFSKIDISKLCYGFVLGVKTWPSWAIFPQVFWQYCHSFPGILYKEVRKRGHHLLMPKMTWLEASHLRLDFLLRFLSPNTFNNHSKNFFTLPWCLCWDTDGALTWAAFLEALPSDVRCPPFTACCWRLGPAGVTDGAACQLSLMPCYKPRARLSVSPCPLDWYKFPVNSSKGKNLSLGIFSLFHSQVEASFGKTAWATRIKAHGTLERASAGLWGPTIKFSVVLWAGCETVITKS